MPEKGAEELKKRKKSPRRKRQIRRFITLLILFAMTLALAIFLIYEHYHVYPGNVERDSIRLMGRGTDYLAFRWNGVRNTDEYTVYFKKYVRETGNGQGTGTTGTGNSSSGSDKIGDEEIPRRLDESWQERKTKGTEIMFSDLEQGTTYAFAVRADSADMEGRLTRPRTFSTKKTQTLKIADKITKLTSSKPFKLNTGAMTDLRYESSDPEVADVDEKTGEIVIKGPGVTEIKVEALETAHYKADSGVTELRVLESYPVRSGGAKAYNIYHLSPDNCEVVKVVRGADGHDVPQSFGYGEDKYWIAYGMSGQGRIVTYPVDGEESEGREVITPSIALNHPNGFAYSDETKMCYSVRGWSSRAITYDTVSGSFSTMNFSYGCSGIAYDSKEKYIYTSSRTIMAAYDVTDGYSVVNTAGVVSHSGSWATQDVGGHAGIMLRCLSPNSNVHGTNVIDLYDMREGMYLGSLSCDLSEVESAIVNKDGFLEILANNSGSDDYIWRTDINIETIGEGINYEE